MAEAQWNTSLSLSEKYCKCILQRSLQVLPTFTSCKFITLSIIVNTNWKNYLDSSYQCDKSAKLIRLLSPNLYLGHPHYRDITRCKHYVVMLQSVLCHTLPWGADVPAMCLSVVGDMSVFSRVMMGRRSEARLISPDKPHGSSLSGRMCLVFGLSAARRTNLEGRQCCHPRNSVDSFNNSYWQKWGFWNINVSACFHCFSGN